MLALLLTLAPYIGPAMTGSIPGTSKFAISVHGAPGATVMLRTVGVPKNYVASFCTERICSPFRVSVTLGSRGLQTIELQLIENEPGGVRPASVTVAANHGERASIAFARGTH